MNTLTWLRDTIVAALIWRRGRRRCGRATLPKRLASLAGRAFGSTQLAHGPFASLPGGTPLSTTAPASPNVSMNPPDR
jgi:hypothetical protein